MPYKEVQELPESVKNVLPTKAQKIYLSAYNNAWDQYKDPEDRKGNDSREDVSRKVAWSAVKSGYEKGDDGEWHKKSDD